MAQTFIADNYYSAHNLLAPTDKFKANLPL